MDQLGILGAHLQQQHQQHVHPHPHADSISFGIDQILSGVEHSCMLGVKMHEPDYGHAAYGGATAAAGGFSCEYGGAAGSCGVSAYHMNMCMNVSGSNGASSAGVIRVPAHRPPLTCGNAPPSPVHQGGLAALTFPWMESNRRYTKDRFTGRCWRRSREVSLHESLWDCYIYSTEKVTATKCIENKNKVEAWRRDR